MIKIKNLNIRLGNFQIKNVELKVKKGEFLVLLGPTAAGKSVILEAIAGLVPIKSGKILVNNRDITQLKPEHRNISICYQDYNLFPHMNVRNNIGYGLRFKKDRNNPHYQKNFRALVDLLKLEDILDRLPLNLSGGEQQRVSLARGLIGSPDVLLLDEPLSALDPNIKTSIQEELKNIHQTLHTTIIMVTHDFIEANYLAERVAIIHEGKGHPRAGGTFPRVLGKYVREDKALSLVEALRKMTLEPAIRLNLNNKGQIGIGYDADITIFNPDTIADGPTFENIDIPNKGIDYVLVGGQISCAKNKIVNDKAGMFINFKEVIKVL